MTNMDTVETIQRDVTVNADPARAFRLFTAGIGSWWPTKTHSLAAEEEHAVRSVVFEERTGGRVYEVAADGTEDTWATVLAWEPPTRLVLAWKPSHRDDPPTEVEVRFSPAGSGTRVDLEHRGWERLGADAAERAESYPDGWVLVLGRFAAAVAER
ncbi:MAG: SRPBCC domain-containing protein [Nocardioidaceae bacterium]|nr:SRPBCC domain-containing protein [Nocardioidaceae bacterium]